MIREITVVRTCWLFIFFCWPPLFMVCSNMFLSCTWKKNGMLNWYSLTYKEVGFLLPSRKGFAALRNCRNHQSNCYLFIFPCVPSLFFVCSIMSFHFLKEFVLVCSQPVNMKQDSKMELEGTGQDSCNSIQHSCLDILLSWDDNLCTLIFCIQSSHDICKPSCLSSQVFWRKSKIDSLPVCLPKFSYKKSKIDLICNWSISIKCKDGMQNYAYAWEILWCLGDILLIILFGSLWRKKYI